MRRGAFAGLPSLQECSVNPQLDMAWGCSEPAHMMVRDTKVDKTCGYIEWGGQSILLYRHPMKLIPKSVLAWEMEYRYAGDNYSIVPFLDRHPCALELKDIYDSIMKK